MKKPPLLLFIFCLAAATAFAAQARAFGHATAAMPASFVLTDYGADNTGTDDCTPAFGRLLEALGGTEQADIYFPAGKYRFCRRMVIDLPNFAGYDSNKGLVLRGAGEDATEIICDNGEGGLSFRGKSNRITVTVRDLSFVTARESGGTALEYDNQNPGDHHARMLQVRNVLVRGESAFKGYFTNGVVCRNAWYPMFENVKITGQYGGDTAGKKMEAGIDLYNCYSPLAAACYVWGAAAYGLRYEGTDFEPEDGIVRDSYFVGQDCGIFLHMATAPAWGEPAFHITDCHINYGVTGIYVEGVRQFFIRGNLFYCGNAAGSRWWKKQGKDTPADGTAPRDIDLAYGTDGIIADNQFTEPANPERVAVDIGEKSGQLLIQGNIFNFDGTGIRNRSRIPSRCIGNVFGGEPHFSVGLTPYRDETGTLKKIDFE